MNMQGKELPEIISIGVLNIEYIGKGESFSGDYANKKDRWLGSKAHLELLKQSKEKGEKTQWEEVAEHILDNFDLYFSYACKEKQPIVLFAMYYMCKRGFIDTFLLSGKEMFFAAQYKMTEELINKSLAAIDKELSTYQKILNSVVANEFLEELLFFKEHMAAVICESRTLAKSLNIIPVINSLGEAVEKSEMQAKQQVSYKWLKNSDTELPKLYQRLITKTLIHPDTTFEHFKAVFTAKPLQSITPIKWDGGKGLLAYFIDTIYSNNIIHFNTEHWSVAKKCFIEAENLAQSKDRYLANKNQKHLGKPKNYHVVDEVLKGL